MNTETQIPDDKLGWEYLHSSSQYERRKAQPALLRVRAAAVTLNGELNEASSFSIRVDGVTGEEDRVLTLCWLQLFEEKQKGKYQGDRPPLSPSWEN